MGIRARQQDIQDVYGDSESWLDLRAVLVSLACLLGAAYSSYLLYQNIQSFGARSGTPMAKLERAEAKVRLKPASSFVWGNVKANEDLYRKDSIQTAPAGGATVRFNDGTLLEVGENSLIIIDSVDHLSLNFLRGSAVLRTRSGDSRISLDKNGKTKIEALPIRLIQPEALSRYFSDGAKTVPIEFTWELKPKEGQAIPDGVSVQISADRSFRTGAKEIAASAGASTVSASLAPGDYYWRVLSHGQALGEASQFSVESVSGLKPLFPGASDKVPVFGADGSVQFRWVASDSPADSPTDSPMDSEDEDEEGFKVAHRIEIASDPSFKSILHSQPIAASAGSAVIPGIQGDVAGTQYYWRIVSRYESQHSRLSVRSGTEKFAVEKIANVPIALGSPSDGEAVRKGQVHFSWQSGVDSVSYRFQLRPENAAVQSVDMGKSMVYSWNDTRAGRYRWQVQAVYQGKVVGESPWRSFLASDGVPISLRAPEEGQAFHYWTDPPRFNFSWNADPEARSYLLEVATDPSFKDASTAKTSGTELASQQIQFKSGAQFWRVSALDASGNVTNVSVARRLDYGVFPPLRAPASATPAAGSVLNPLEMNQDPVITWDSVPEAQAYEVTIQQGGHVVVQQLVKETQFALKGFQAGKYAYTVRALDKLQRKGEPLSDRAFEISYGQPLAAPEALSPEVQ